jgi:hypothetical protein
METNERPETATEVSLARPFVVENVRRKRTWLRVLVILGLLGVLAIAVFIATLWSGYSAVEPVAEAYLALIEAGDYSAAYDVLGDEFRRVDSTQSFAKLQRRFRAILGPLQAKRAHGFQVKHGTAGSMAVTRYAATFANGDAEIIITLSKTSGKWKVIGHHVNTPLFEPILKCKRCGRQAQTLVDFCPSCGNPMFEGSVEDAGD